MKRKNDTSNHAGSEASPEITPVIQKIVSEVKELERASFMYKEEVKYAAPIPRPAKNVFAVGPRIYRDG